MALLSLWGQGPCQYPWFLRCTDGSQDWFDDYMHECGQASFPFPFLLLCMPQALIPFQLGVLTHPFAFRFVTGDCSAPPNFPVLYPCPIIPPPCWNNAWANAISPLGSSVSYPSQISLLFPLHSLTNKPGFHTQVALTTRPRVVVPLIRMKILWGRIFCLILP